MKLYLKTMLSARRHHTSLSKTELSLISLIPFCSLISVSPASPFHFSVPSVSFLIVFDVSVGHQ